MVNEVLETQTKSVASPIRIEAHDVAKGIEVFRLAVSGKPHDLVFVAKFREAKILGDPAVIEPERVGKRDRIGNLHPLPAPVPHIVLAKSPRPSAESKAARSNGETKNALARCA